MDNPRDRLALVMSALLAAGLVGGCVRPIFPGSERVFGRGTDVKRVRETGRREPAQGDTTLSLGLARKVVAGKEEPTTLLAVDGDRCTTTPEHFKEVRVGDRAWCAWRQASAPR